MRLRHAVLPIPVQAVPVAVLRTTVVWKAYVVAAIVEAVRCALPERRLVAAVPVVLRHTTVAVRPPHVVTIVVRVPVPAAVLMIITVLPVTLVLPVSANLPAAVHAPAAILLVVVVILAQVVAEAVLPAEAVAEEDKY